MYQTIEARLKNDKIIFENDFNVPKNNVKVLITFLETEFYDQDEKNLDDALKSNKVKNKFKELSNLISKGN